MKNVLVFAFLGLLAASCVDSIGHDIGPDAMTPDSAGSGSASAFAGKTGADDGVAMLGLAAGLLVCGLRLRMRRRTRATAAGEQHDPAWALIATTQANEKAPDAE
jgi:hypothetical protein